MARNFFERRPVRSRRRGFTAGELRLTLLAALFVGLVAASVPTDWMRSGAAEPSAPAPASDYYAESRRSRAILEAQEGAPATMLGDAAERVPSGGAIRVVDGDTFWLGGDKIRIADIDTPETHPPRCAHEAELGERATRRLAALLAEDSFELERIGRDTDRYGRKLRIVTRGGRSIGDTLIAEGLARPYAGGRRPWCA